MELTYGFWDAFYGDQHRGGVVENHLDLIMLAGVCFFGEGC